MTYIGAFALAILFVAAILRMDTTTAGFWIVLVLVGIAAWLFAGALDQRRSERQ